MKARFSVRNSAPSAGSWFFRERRKFADPGAHERQVLDRVDERVPLEERPLLPEQPVELRAVVPGAEPAEEDEVLRPLDRRDDVDLEEAEPPHRLEDAGRAAVERLRAHRDPSRLLEADLHRRLRHRGAIYVSRLRPRAAAGAAGPGARRRLRAGRADDVARRRGLRRARDRSARAAGRATSGG